MLRRRRNGVKENRALARMHVHLAIGTGSSISWRGDCIDYGRFDVAQFNPLARLEYRRFRG